MKPFLLKPGVVLATAGFAVAAPPSSYNKVQVESAFLFIQVEILKPGALSNLGVKLAPRLPQPPTPRVRSELGCDVHAGDQGRKFTNYLT